MKVKLTVQSIDKAIEKLKLFEEDISDIAIGRIVETLVTKGVSKASSLNASAPQSGVDKSIIISNFDQDSASGFVALHGRNAVYDEFGTGTQGASNPHPMKGYFDLNPYNSGPTIFYNEMTGTYQWRYQPMAGRPYFTSTGLTEGIPAGKVMYDTGNYIHSIKNNVIEKELKGSLKKLK